MTRTNYNSFLKHCWNIVAISIKYINIKIPIVDDVVYPLNRWKCCVEEKYTLYYTLYYCFLPDICFVCSNFVSNVVVTLRDIQLYNVDTMWNMHLCIAEKKSLEWEGQLATMVFIYILVCVTSIIWCDCIVPEEEIICTSDCNSDFVRCNQDCNQDMECQNQCLRQITICVENCPCHENCLNGCPCSSYCESQTPSGIKHDFETEDLNVLGYRKSVNDKSV